MMKKRYLSLFLSLILVMLFPVSISANSDWTVLDINTDFNSDIIVSTDDFAWTEGFADILYNGKKMPAGNFEINSVLYKLSGDFYAEGNDAIKISGNGKFELTFNDELIKKVGIIAATCDNSVSLNIKATYDDATFKTENYTILPLTSEVSSALAVEKAVLPVADSGMTFFEQSTQDAYLNAYTFDNEVKKLRKVTFENTSSNDVYILAVSTVMFSEEDLAGAADDAITKYYDLYKDKSFTDLNDATVSEVETLRDGLIAGKQTENEYSTDENISKFTNMVDGYYLYNAWNKEKAVVDLYDYYKKTDADFPSFSEADKENMENAIEAYKKLEKLDYEKLIMLCDEFNVESGNLYVASEDYSKTEELYNNYLIYLEIKALEEENASLYATYINKQISTLTEADILNIDKYVSNYERLIELGSVPSENKLNEMNEIKEYYNNYLNSEKPIYADLSAIFNFESIGTKGDKTPEGWMGGTTYNHFWGKDYKLIYNIDETTGIVTLDDQYFTSTPKNDGTYSVKWNLTGKKYSFRLTGLKSGEKDTLDLSKLTESGRTISLTPRVTDKIYIAITSNTYDSPESTAQDIIINYTDGTQSEPYTILPSSGYDQSWGGSSTTGEGYEYQNGYMYVTGSSALANKDGVLDYVSRPQQRENGVVGTYALNVDTSKQVSSITFDTPSVSNIFLYAITQEPSKNDVFKNVISAQWNIVKDYDIASLSEEELKEASLMMAYKKEADERGIAVSEYADKEKIALMNDAILTVSGQVKRYDIDTINAELKFSSKVSEDILKSALSISKEGKNVSDYDLSLSDDGKKAYINIPCDEKGGASIKIEISTNLAPSDYPENKLSDKFEITYMIPEYLTIGYEDGKISVTNNSETNAAYNLYFTYYNPETYEVLFASENEFDVSFAQTEGFSEYIYVTDDNYKHIASYSEISLNTDKVEKDVNYKNISHQLSDNIIKVSGYTPSKEADKCVNIKIKDANGRILAFLSEKTSANGAFSFSIKIPDGMIINEGYAKIILSGDDFIAPYTDTNSVYLSKSTSKLNAVEAIKSASTEALAVTALKNAKNILGLSNDLFTAMADSMGKRLINIQSELDSSDLNGAKNIILREEALEAFSKGKTDLLLKDGKLLYDDVMDYEKIDENGVTLYSVFKDLLTLEGKEKAISDLNGKALDTTEILRKELAAATANSVLSNCSKGGFEKFTCILTPENASLLGIDISNYTQRTDKTALLNYLAANNITSVSNLEAFVKAYSTTVIQGGSSTPSGGGGSGSRGSSTGSINVSPDVLENPNVNTPTSNTVFKDVSEKHWAYSYIKNIKEKNIINGDEKGNFNPDNKITRAEFIKILVNAAGYEADSAESSFNDVDKNSWYYKYVSIAYKNGIINGDEKGNFNPDSYITREDICVMIHRLSSTDKMIYKSDYIDSESISDYAKDAVAYLSEKGIVNGFSGNMFKPKDNATRAQCAKIISEYLSK